tara:strand:+ start:3912 stop:4274 length:363 start_codon:yes stop_codon:yes gene_type:complete
MATYLAADTRGSGSLGESINGKKTFVITNSKNSQGQYPVGYLTLEGNSNINQNLNADISLTGSINILTGGISEDSIVMSDTKWSISIFGATGEFEFTPNTPIPQDSYYIKGVGPFDLAIV